MESKKKDKTKENQKIFNEFFTKSNIKAEVKIKYMLEETNDEWQFKVFGKKIKEDIKR